MSHPRRFSSLSATVLGGIVDLGLVVVAVMMFAHLLGTALYHINAEFRKLPDPSAFPGIEAAGIRIDQLTCRIPVPASARGWFFLWIFTTLVIALYFLLDLRQILKSVRKDKLFTRKNADRLRGMACLLLVLFVVEIAVADTLASALRELPYSELHVVPTRFVEAWSVIGALVLFVMADVLAHAASHQAEAAKSSGRTDMGSPSQTRH